MDHHLFAACSPRTRRPRLAASRRRVGAAAGCGPDRRSMPTSRDAMAAAIVATVAWNLYGFADNFFERAWADAPIPVVPLAYDLNAALVAVLPLSRSGRRGTTAVATALGGLMGLWSASGLVFLADGVGLGSRLPATLGPGVPTVLGALIAAFGARAYRRSG